ncbi:MAG: XRE family transcriptional regulator [Acetobacter sp.]|nr:XRE family transcriptional regulator [Bacteroides sp.]MCM1341670.1 XRE family transcriptional regulator [Acetobacter sp.]MCM1434281.1 XRE family transcriptional regulator [Clostridiales bacterium]
MLGNRIRNLRKQAGYTQDELAQLLRLKYGLGTDRVMISKWETEFQEPQMHSLKCLANLFGVTVDYLNGENSLNSPTISTNNVEFAVIGDVAAGFDKVAIEDWTGDRILIPESYLKSRSKDDFFVLRVKGNSMYPEYRNGDKVLILKQTAVDYSGQIAVAIYNDELGTIKKIEYKKDSVHLVPINPQYEPEVIKGSDIEKIHILGIPKLLIREIEE